jgi:hypothetical protein
MMIKPEFVAILISIVVLFFLIRGMVKEAIYFRGVIWKRNENPILYWLSLTMGFVSVIVTIVISLVLLFP